MNENSDPRRTLMLEHAMRVSRDDLALLPLLDAAPASDEAYAAVGTIAVTDSPRLVAGTPMLAWLLGTDIVEGWQVHVPAGPDSLWSHLLFLRTHMVAAPVPGENPLDELLRLRHESSFLTTL